MNAMTEAFIRAGAKAPTIAERLWRIIKDEPGLTATQMQKRLPAIKVGSISSQLSLMETRSMVYVKGTKGQGPKGTAKAYYTDMERYERLPAPKPTTHMPAPAPAATPDISQPLACVPQSAPAGDVFDLDSLTIREARALYLKLKEMFRHA
jgi:hypothetical protein